MHLHRQGLAGVVLVAAALLTAVQLPGQQAPPFDPGATPLWHVAGAARGTPVVDDDTAYFLAKEREVVAIDVHSGAVRWRSGTGVTSVDGIFGDTTAGTNLAIVGPHVIGADWDVVAFDRATGKRQWAYAAPDGDGPGLFLGHAGGGVVYTGSPGGKVYAIRAATGEPAWIAPIGEGPVLTSVFPPVVHGDLVIAGYSAYHIPNVGGLVVLDADTGRVRWRREFPAARERWQHTNFTGGPIVIDDLVFGAAGDGNIYAFDLATGAVRWSFPRLANLAEDHQTAMGTDLDHRALVRAGRLVIAGSATGYVVAYDVDTRSERWRHYDGRSGSTMFWFAADDRRAYVPFFGGFIVAIDLATGAEQWRTGDFMKGFIWPPAVVDDRLYLGGAYAGFLALSQSRKETLP